jgi:folate-binding protein YgfZ
MTGSFGNPNQEQKDLLAGKSFVYLDKKVLVVSGDERLTWLNDILSQKLDDLAVGVSVEALWLDAQGRIIRDFHIIDDGEKTYLITFSKDFEDFFNQFKRMVFRAKVTLETSEELKVIATFGTEKLSSLTWQDPWPETAIGGHRYGQAILTNWDYQEQLVTNLELEKLRSSLTEAGTLALEALRIAAFRPSGPDEIDERSLPHEYDWLATAVHLSKGCYRGQETVAKVHNLGAPPRRMVFLHLDGSAHLLPPVGDEIRNGEEVIGKVTSVGQHYEMGPIALGLIKRNTKVETVLVGTIPATLEQIVPPDAGGVIDLGDFRGKKN